MVTATIKQKQLKCDLLLKILLMPLIPVGTVSPVCLFLYLKYLLFLAKDLNLLGQF